jgi:hypothetical protein
MPSLRFENEALQAQFLKLLESLPFQPELRPDGSVVCSTEQWPQVNALAHRVRSGCYPWYFSWCDSEEYTAEKERYLRDNGLRFEIEHHDHGKVFLLPKEDADKHNPAGDESGEGSGPLKCSFCGGRSVDRDHMYAAASEDVTICNECIEWLYADLKDR